VKAEEAQIDYDYNTINHNNKHIDLIKNCHNNAKKYVKRLQNFLSHKKRVKKIE
jgi:hypothetical protein